MSSTGSNQWNYSIAVYNQSCNMLYKVPYYFVEVVWSMVLITHWLPPLLRPGGAQAARVLHPRYMDTRCSEQNRRKTVTQSFRGLPRPKVATSARPPATRDFPRAAGDFFCRRSHNARRQDSCPLSRGRERQTR